MKPDSAFLLDNLGSTNIRYTIPVYQRNYAWEDEQCLQLWEDVLAIGRSNNGSHFTGSIVWIRSGEMSGTGEIEAMLIDGQQRMTTLSLFLIALADYAKSNDGLAPDGSNLDFYAEDICEQYLLHNKRSNGPDRYELTLNEEDNETYHSLVERLMDPNHPVADGSSRILHNYELIRTRLEGLEDPRLIWHGVKKLQIISVSLEPGQDNPQEIFESMNSTGKDLMAADLIRNYVLMGLASEDQSHLFVNFWRPMEKKLGAGSDDFDRFLHDYLALRLAPTPVNPKDVYPQFKRMCTAESIRTSDDMESLLANMLEHAGTWAKITLNEENDVSLRPALRNLAALDITVVNPLLMYFYDARAQGLVDTSGLAELLAITESYLTRRAVCGCSTNSLNRFFPSMIFRLRNLPEDIELEEGYIALLQCQQNTKSYFPEDAEFEEELRTRNMYGFKKCLFVLNRLENSAHPKNPTDFFEGTYSIEHIMPQNALAHEEWVQALGGHEAAAEAFDALVNNLGNLTVTAYNSELSDGSFEDKKNRMVGGYANDAVSLSAGVVSLDHWDSESIKSRAKELSKRALSIWAKPIADEHLVELLSDKDRRDAGSSTRSENFPSLFSRGAIRPGDRLVHAGSDGTVYAEVGDNGRIILQNGESFRSPSKAAVRAVALLGGTGNTRNGWKYWSVQRDGGAVQLSELRARTDAEEDESPILGLRRAFWGGFYEYASDTPEFTEAFGDLSQRQENDSNSCSLGIGKSDVNLHAYVYLDSSYTGVWADVYFHSAKPYADYYRRREEIESSLEDLAIQWDELDCDKKSRRVTAEFPSDTTDVDTWPADYEWLVDTLLKLKAEFE